MHATHVKVFVNSFSNSFFLSLFLSSFLSFFLFLLVKVIQYFLASKGQEACNFVCQSNGLQCVETGGFPSGEAVSIFASFGFTCKIILPYKYADNPCYFPTTNLCYGATSIPSKISCSVGGNPDARRLCPCY